MSHCEDFLLVSSVWPAAGSRPEFWWANYEECNYKLLLHCYTVHCTCTTHYITHYTAAFPSTSTSSCSYLSSVTGTAAMFIIRVFILALIPHWTITVYGWETQRQDSSSDCAPPPATIVSRVLLFINTPFTMRHCGSVCPPCGHHLSQHLQEKIRVCRTIPPSTLKWWSLVSCFTTNKTEQKLYSTKPRYKSPITALRLASALHPTVLNIIYHIHDFPGHVRDSWTHFNNSII